MTRLLLVAGEASGDLHGGLLARALRERMPTVELYGLGGSEMERAGVRLIARSDEMGVTGLAEVVRELPRLRKRLGEMARWIETERPDAFIPIDYPDFNLRLAARAREAGIPTIYYIAPQAWAWRRGRIRSMRRLIRRLVVIFPFEEEFYRREGIAVTYVGHPLVERVRAGRSREEIRQSLGVGTGEWLVALLPGSRRSEIERILPVLLATRERLRGDARIRWVLALAPGLGEKAIEISRGAGESVAVRQGQTYDILAAADLAIVASGTATLEGAILGTPMLVVYRMHPLTWLLASRLVRVPHVAMANLLAGERVVPEFLQGRADPVGLSREVVDWLEDPERRRATSERLRLAASGLGDGGAPSRAAEAILAELGS